MVSSWYLDGCEGDADEKIEEGIAELKAGRVADITKNLYPPTSALGSLSL